jgi:hypothetical protein
MATNSPLKLSSIDFDTLKENFKEFLKTQSVFKDYDFDGSNINVLLDVMSYNSFLNAFYLNMVASEMFLDSAQKYDSVISHAKELNYLPRSAKSSIAEINLSLETTINSGKLNIPKGTRFAGFNANGSFTFTTDQAKVLSSGSNTFTTANLLIYEGDYYKDSFVVDYSIENQQFVLTNKNIDVNSLTLNVVENNGSSNTEFKRVETLFGLNGQSNVYFLQGAQSDSYEIVFGDSLFGRKPQDGAVLNANYRVSSGIEADGITVFSLQDDFGPINSGQITSSTITLVSSSSGGSEKENMDSIRFSAPRYFATQQRAISSDDYKSLVLVNFGGEISDVAVYGGQEIEPKLYGRVIVAVKPTTGTIAPNYIKNKIYDYLQEYVALPNRVVITDPEYTYCKIFTEVQYDPKSTTKTSSEIQTAVLSSILNYSSTNLEKFANDLRYSRLTASIDSADSSITSNDTELRIIKRIIPNFNQDTTYNISVGNVLYYDASIFSDNAQHKQLHDSELDSRYSHATLISSNFTYNGSDGKVYELAFFEDDGNGNILLYAPIGTELLPIETVGTIDYATGNINLNEINVANYSNYISLYIRSRFKDIYAAQNKIITIDPNDVTISVIETQR